MFCCLRYCDYLTGNKIKKKAHFLSPSGHVFESRKEAIDYGVRIGVAQDDLEILKKGLKIKGSQVTTSRFIVFV